MPGMVKGKRKPIHSWYAGHTKLHPHGLGAFSPFSSQPKKLERAGRCWRPSTSCCFPLSSGRVRCRGSRVSRCVPEARSVLMTANVSPRSPWDTRAHRSQWKMVWWLQWVLDQTLSECADVSLSWRKPLGHRGSCSTKPGRTCLLPSVVILSTKQPGNGGVWLGHSPVFKTGKICSDSVHQLFCLQSEVQWKVTPWLLSPAALLPASQLAPAPARPSPPLLLMCRGKDENRTSWSLTDLAQLPVRV